MLAARIGLRTAFRSATRAIPRQTPKSPFVSRIAQQTRFQSRYQRFGDQKKGSSGQAWSNIGPIYRVQYIWRNYQRPILVVSGGGLVFYVANQEQVPITQRRRFNVISPEKEKQYAAEGYNDTLREFRGRILPENHPYTQLVARVVERLLPSVGPLAGDEWRVHVIDAPDQRNAFVLPGGKVFVFTGLLPICQDENGLAAVLGHEIAHNVAHHLSERISQSFITLAFAFAASFVFDISGGLANSLGSLLLSMPNSRTQEMEADHIGLLMMAESCYDPNSAIGLWTRMAEAEKGAPPQFLSTHPTSYNRRELIRGWIPEAEAKYNESECSVTSRYAEDFKKAFGVSNSSQIGQGRRIPVQQQGPPQHDDDDDFF